MYQSRGGGGARRARETRAAGAVGSSILIGELARVFRQARLYIIILWRCHAVRAERPADHRAVGEIERADGRDGLTLK